LRKADQIGKWKANYMQVQHRQWRPMEWSESLNVVKRPTNYNNLYTVFFSLIMGTNILHYGYSIRNLYITKTWYHELLCEIETEQFQINVQFFYTPCSLMMFDV
jgi:hypothetical protein